MHLGLGMIIYCKIDADMKYPEGDLLLQDGLQAGGTCAPQPHCALQESPVCVREDFWGWREVNCPVCFA